MKTSTHYTACNGTNAAGLLHCPAPESANKDDFAGAEKYARRKGLTHVAKVHHGIVLELTEIATTT